MTHQEIYDAWAAWSPEHAAMATKWAPWGKHSIVVWLNNGYAYKCKMYGGDKFIMQVVSKEDIEKKFNGGMNK